jgi:hypothetical protein
VQTYALGIDQAKPESLVGWAVKHSTFTDGV